MDVARDDAKHYNFAVLPRGMMADAPTRVSTLSNSSNALDHVVVRLRLIGQMEAWTIRSESVLPAGRKTRALLASIALAAPRPALRGRLAEQLWSRRPEEQARASLRQEIHRLLDALSPAGDGDPADHARPSDLAAGRRLDRRRGSDAGNRGADPRRWRCWMATCWRIWTASIRTSMHGCTRSANACATGPAASPSRC